MTDSKKRLWIWLIAGLMLLCIVASAISLCVGSAQISVADIIPSLMGQRGQADYSILVNIRLPRILLGFAVGGALSLAGALLQGIFRNPLVEPYTIGISGGASLGVCLAIIFDFHLFMGIIAYPLSGFAGALLTMFLVYFLSANKQVMRIQGVLLTGVMISFISSSLFMLIKSFSDDEDLRSIVFWIMGSLDEPNLALIWIAVGVSVSGLIISYFFCLSLNAFALGEEEAAHLGVNTERAKKILFVIASILTGLSVSVAGVIGFVGLVVPHLIRLFTGPDHRILLLASFLGGSAFMIFSDTIARTIIMPRELPVGVITGIIGGCVFIYALNKRKVNL
ncbi:MAG: iron ABC transporter permease [Fibrobacteria bacterium]|nr:iron ABC transporter permease [Fibrobacteria bacterium]